VPTTKTRYQVTETPEVAHALEVAARRWPEIASRSALLAALAEEGARMIEEDEVQRRAKRRALVESVAGGFAYEPDFLEKLREDWPE
jgi:hypothetical protein